MKRWPIILLCFVVGQLAASAVQDVPLRTSRGKQLLPPNAEILSVSGKSGFLALPDSTKPGPRVPWLWYFPTEGNLPGRHETWLMEKCLSNGIAVAGLDLGAPMGNPVSRASLTAFYEYLTTSRDLTPKACLIGRSRGGLQMYNWASEHPERVACIAGIYTVCDMASWPGLAQASKAYGMSVEQLSSELSSHNPIDRLQPLAEAGVPIHIVHGDIDKLVPLDRNSGLLATRYKALGGPITLDIKQGQGHNYWSGFFQDEGMAEFVITHAKKSALPRVLIFGDSICGGYANQVIKLLDGKATVTKLGSVPGYRIQNRPLWQRRPAGYLNFGSAKTCISDFDRFEKHLAETEYDVIHFNFGLNDIFRGRNGAWHCPPEEYANCLERIVTALNKNGASVIWANTTPIPDNDPDRPAGDDVIYNSAAEAVMKKHKIPVNDLHGVITAWDGYSKWKQGSDVHFSGGVYAQLAGQVAMVITRELGTERSDASSMLWYDKPATSWQSHALPIGNGRIGAMIFGGVGYERIALNEESVWSGARVNWNREDAARNLPEIRRLLLAGKNAEAEQMVNQTFTCIRGGSRRGARGPWGCYQELGNLNIVWGSEVKSIPLEEWKYTMITTPGIEDIREQRAEVRRIVDDGAKADTNDSEWDDYVLSEGKAVKGARRLALGDKVLLRHHVSLTQAGLAGLGPLRIDSGAKNGRVYVNGQHVGNLPGWQSIGHARFQSDVSSALKVGDNVVAIYCTNYRRRGQMPLSVSLDPLEETETYRRELDLRTAVSEVTYQRDGVTFTREAFASAPDQVMAFRFTADKPGSITFTATLNRLSNFETTTVGKTDMLLTGRTLSGVEGQDGLQFVARLRALNRGGNVWTEGSALHVSDADEVVLLAAAGTDYQGFAGRGTPNPLKATMDDLDGAARKSYAELRAAHVKDHRSYYDRVSLELGDGGEPSRAVAHLPTDQRHAALRKGGSDPALAALYFNYGRYLMISSSRPGTMPANLQGIWAEGIQTPWNCDYHIDINVQMNYWPAEVTGLGDCHTPLFKLIESLQEPGAETARAYYGARGWVAHVITNPWGFTAPGEQAGWGATATGSPWLCDHLWEHYVYNRDKEFLRWAYPIMKGSAEFFLDMLITEPKQGWLVTAPSNSPENTFMYGDGKNARVCMGPTMDMQILRELFGNCIEAASILGMDEAFRVRLAEARKRLAPNQVGKHGQIQEWLEDYDESEPHHRHVSHLYGLHPYNEISPDTTPELAQAARVSLQRRGDGGSGWSMAWKANFWARLHDGNHALLMLNNLITKGGENLLCQHAPFQIDGNFGGTSGVAEMLLQSHSGVVRLLPALPDAWPAGRARRFRAQGGYEVDIEWADKTLTKAVIRNISADGSCVVRYGQKTATLTIPRNGSHELTVASFK